MISSSLRPGRGSLGAFTLVEIMVVVVIIGLLAALAIPAFKRVQQAAQISQTVNDYRIFAQAFETYNSLNGGWPPNAVAGTVPTGMSQDFKEDNWRAASTPIGGRWNWDLNRSEFKAGVSVSGYTVSDEQLAKIDAKLDDGNLDTGHFLRLGNRATYVLEASP